MTNENSISIKKLENKEELLSAFHLFNQLHNANLKSYKEYIDELFEIEKNHNMIGFFIKNNLVGIVSYWIGVRFYCKKYIEIGNMVVNKKYQNTSIGSKMLKYIENIGKENECINIILDSYVRNENSHKFYFNKGFYIKGFHFIKEIKNNE